MVAPPSTGGMPPQIPAPAKSAPMNRPNGAMPGSAPPTIPYSARRAAPLDMSTVERRNPLTREPPPRNRPHGLMEAPTFTPTEEEFRDPMEYIKSIYDKASKYGICKIIPPQGWDPDFAIDLSRFHFRTRRQELNSVEGGTRANLNYLDQLSKFHRQYGTNLNRFPSVDKRPLDLYKLKKAVEVRGGFDKVCKDKKWAEIGRDLGYSGKIMSSLSTSLKNSYQRWLHPYEEYLRTAKPGVQQQLEQQNGGPYETSPVYSPTKASSSQHNPPTPVQAESLAVQASIAFNSSFGPKEPVAQPSQQPGQQSGLLPVLQPVPQSIPQPAPLPSVEAPRPLPPAPIPGSGFTAVNAGGFSAVNAPCGFVAVNHAPPPNVKHEEDSSSATPNMNGQHQTTYNILPPNYIQTPPSAPPLTNGTGASSNPLKRTMSHDSVNADSGSEGGDGDSGSGRRSKRIKKDAAPPLTGSGVGSMRPSTPRIRSKSGIRKYGDKCEQCNKAEDKDSIVVCESCELGFHKYCLDPPIASLPDYDWHCPKCLVGTGEYGFEEGGIYSLKVFQEKAHNFKQHYFSSRMPFDPVINQHKQPTEDEIEREFWRLVESLTETVEVEYGADIHSTTHGSGFPTIEKNPLNQYSKDPWNLNVLPFHEESLFRHIKTDISGMTVPWLYVGMCFSTFCWHNEDHYTYSANYQHFGATKTWYGIPGKDAHAFEEAMRKAVPELFETQPDLLFQLVTLLPPEQLRKAGVEVYGLDQRAGQFVITFPQAYHAGFNHGFNFNEAVNFAPADWEPFGEAGVERLQEFRRQPCFPHDELLLTAAAVDSTIKTSKWLAPALERMRDRELHLRAELKNRHLGLSPHQPCKVWDLAVEDTPPQCDLSFLVKDEVLQEEDYQCYYCKAYSFLTQFRCHHSGRTSCLLHIEIIDCCGESPVQRLLGPNHTLRYRYSNDDLGNLVQKVIDKAAVPEVWESKLENLLQDEPRPPLKSMHTLLAEGDKIPYALQGLDSLSEFVKRCDLWVDEANLYLTRKQQNRRKNEKAWRRQSTKGTKMEEKDSEPQLTLERMNALIEEGENLGFQCVQLENLNEKLALVNDWRSEAKSILRNQVSTSEQIEAILETGRSFLATMPELTELETLCRRTKWTEDALGAQEAIKSGSTQTLGQCKTILDRAKDLLIAPNVPLVEFFNEQVRQGDFWETKAQEIIAAEVMHYPQLDALYKQVEAHHFPVNPDTLARMDAILTKNREAHRQILTLYEKSQDSDFRKRPLYTDIHNVMKTLEDLNSKPQGTIDLERELKRHEDWMRKGKKLFGKANAPLHILEVHMKFVEEKNNFCFDLNDTFRPPVEPSSREATPNGDAEKEGVLGEDEKPVFCICRQIENGMMIMCEICREWYHSKCLKLARGKMKEFEAFTCPVCDWRVKIPRDAARPKLEDLQLWADEMPLLPFQPEEEDILRRIIGKALGFRDFLQQFTNGNQICRTSEEMPTMLFYLRKLEGAEVLLAHETNSFRQELHKWQPIAPEPPPVLQQSLSTRKPRPTKLQKTMKEMGVEKIEDLPQHLRTKSTVKRKSTDPSVNGTPRPPPLQPAQMQGDGSGSGHGQGQSGARSDTPVGMPRQASTGNAPGNGHYNSNHIPMSMAQSPTYGHPFAASGPPSYAPSTPSPMFSPVSSLPPNGLRDPMMASRFPGGPSAGPSSHDIFSPNYALGMDPDDDIRTGLANGISAEAEPNDMSSPHTGNVDEMFMQMTNQDADTQNDAATGLEAEARQASEALEMIRSASNVSAASHAEDGDEAAIDPENGAFEEFFEDGDAQAL